MIDDIPKTYHMIGFCDPCKTEYELDGFAFHAKDDKEAVMIATRIIEAVHLIGIDLEGGVIDTGRSTIYDMKGYAGLPSFEAREIKRSDSLTREEFEYLRGYWNSLKDTDHSRSESIMECELRQFRKKRGFTISLSEFLAMVNS